MGHRLESNGIQLVVCLIVLTAAQRNVYRIVLRKSGDVRFEGLDIDGVHIIMYFREIIGG
jgi:hypothetical protein